MAIIHEIRADGFGNTKKVQLTPRLAILEFCKECIGFDRGQVKLCTDIRKRQITPSLGQKFSHG